MLDKESEELLSTLIMQVIRGEHRVEISRKCLTELYEFHPESFFYSLCQVYPSEILPRDLKEFLMQNGTQVNDEDVYLMVRQYSSGQNGKLNFEDFCHLVLPSTNEIVSEIARSRIYSRHSKSEKVNSYFGALLKAEIEMQHELEELKIKLFKNPEFSLWKAFETLNLSGKGMVSEEEIRQFMRKFGKFITTEDFDALMRRVDLEEDLQISYNEFLEALIPLRLPGHDETRPKKIQEKEKIVENGEKIQKNSAKFKENEEEPVFTNENIESDEKEGPFDPKDLEKSPDFQDPKEFTMSHESFETPIKGKNTKTRQVPHKKSLDLPLPLSDLFSLELEMERKLEFYRQNLLMMENFSVFQTFRLIDKEEKGEIRVYDFERYLEEIAIEASREIIWKIFKKFGNDQGLTLELENFSRIFECYDDEYLKLLKIEGDEEINQDTYEKIRDLFEVLIKNEERIEDLIEAIRGDLEKHLENVFDLMDYDGNGEVDVQDLRTVLKSFGLRGTDKDLLSLIYRYSNRESPYFVKSDFVARFAKVEN